MEKVDSTAASILNANFNSGIKTQVKKSQSKNELQGSRKSKFSEVMESFTSILGPIKELPPSEEALTELMDAVHSTGSDLRDRPFPDEILRYKRAVRNFINYVVDTGYEIYKDQGISKMVVVGGERVKQANVYHQIRIIDQKLDELASAILSGQATQLTRVSKLDEITGLLVDLTISGAIKERDEEQR